MQSFCARGSIWNEAEKFFDKRIRNSLSDSGCLLFLYLWVSQPVVRY